VSLLKYIIYILIFTDKFIEKVCTVFEYTGDTHKTL